ITSWVIGSYLGLTPIGMVVVVLMGLFFGLYLNSYLLKDFLVLLNQLNDHPGKLLKLLLRGTKRGEKLWIAAGLIRGVVFAGR
ncbi:hypothetical protein U1Q18_037999, partial [Sarracenia purpurea var. burkii]